MLLSKYLKHLRGTKKCMSNMETCERSVQ